MRCMGLLFQTVKTCSYMRVTRTVFSSSTFVSYYCTDISEFNFHFESVVTRSEGGHTAVAVPKSPYVLQSTDRESDQI